MNIKHVIIAVILMALITYIPRMLPITIFRKEIKSTYICSFLNYVPYAVLGALTFPDIFYSTHNLKTAIFGTIVAIFLAYKEKSLLIVAIGAILAAYLSSFIF